VTDLYVWNSSGYQKYIAYQKEYGACFGACNIYLDLKIEANKTTSFITPANDTYYFGFQGYANSITGAGFYPLPAFVVYGQTYQYLGTDLTKGPGAIAGAVGALLVLAVAFATLPARKRRTR